MSLETVLTAIFAVIASLLTGWYANRKMNAETASIYQKMLQEEIDARKAERKEADELRQKLEDELRSLKIEFAEQILELRELLEDFKGWGKKLAEQVRELGGEPIDFVPRKRKK